MKTKFKGILTLILALVVQMTFAQELETVTGTVTTADGMPLPGVNVIVQGTTRGEQTDFDGNYSIEVSEGEVLVYSYLGMTTVEKLVGDVNIIDVVLQPDAAQLQEVVVTGYGIERAKRTTTYATETVDNDQLTIAAPTSAASALAGKVAGLQINVTSNGVNPSSQIILRGLRSISQNNEALIVIDGAISTQGAFDDLNPINIKSINVLKGATAAALYGSRAGNGAVIVTTKNGSTLEGDGFTIGLNSSTTFEEVAYMPDFQDNYGTGWQGVYDPVENTNWGPAFDGVVRQIGPTFADGTFQEVPYAVVEDNAKDFYETGVTLQNTVYFSGADENSNFYLSVGDQETTGIVPENRFRSNTFRLNASQEMGDLTLSVNSSFSRDERSIVGNDIGAQNRQLYWFILNVPRNIPLTRYKDWRTDLYASPNGYYNAYYQNPYWAIDTNRDMDESMRLSGNVAASWDITEWLNFTTRLGLNRATQYGKNWRAAQTYTDAYTRPSPVTSFVEDYEFQSLQYTSDAILTADFDFLEDFTLQAILGATQFTAKSRESEIRANNLSIPGFYDISNGTGEPVVFVDEEINKNYGFFGDFTFGYNNYLFLHVAGRQDFTSTLPAEDNSYFYPSIGVSAVLTDIIPTLEGDVLNYLKLSASNSTVYNDLSPFQINEVFVQQDANNQNLAFPYGTVNGFALNSITVDPNIQKEKLNTTEVTASFAFFANRLTLDASWYNTVTSNLITFTTPGPASGATDYLTNIGETENTGYELSLGARIFDYEDFGWDFNLNYTHFETIVNEIKPGLDEIQVAGTGEFGVYAVVGEAFPQIKATSYVRDDQGRVVVDAETGNPEVGGLKNMGSTLPEHIFGLVNTFRYKDFTLSATMDYRTGHVYYSQLADIMEFTGRSVESASANRQDFVWPNSVIEVSEGVYEENTNISVTEGKQDFWTENYNAIKENYVRDATALKLREVALNYRLPQEFLESTFINKLTVGLVGRNLITWLPEENRFSDPEFQGQSGNAIGISGFFQSPPTRNYGFSINVEF